MNASVIVVKFCGVDYYATHGVRGSQAASTRIKLVASRRDYCVCVCVCVLSFDTNASCRYTPSHLKHVIFSKQFTLSTPRRELPYELHFTRFTTNLTNTLCRLSVASISDYTLHNRNSQRLFTAINFAHSFHGQRCPSEPYTRLESATQLHSRCAVRILYAQSFAGAQIHSQSVGTEQREQRRERERPLSLENPHSFISDSLIALFHGGKSLPRPMLSSCALNNIVLPLRRH